MTKKLWIIFLMIFFILEAGCAQMLSHILGVEPGEHQVMVFEKNVMVPMRDGVKLATDIYRPRGEGKYPVILNRMPYGTDDEMFKELGRFFVRHGYIFINQDTRGTYSSEGVYFPLVWERNDGIDTCKWIAQQPWFNGKLGTWGVSYFAYTQWAESPNNPLITAMNPVFGTGSIFKFVFRGGALTYVQMIPWNTGMQNAWYKKQGINKKIEVDLLSGGYYNYPIREAKSVNVEEIISSEERVKAEAEKGVFDWIQHPGDIVNVSADNFEGFYDEVSAPSLQVAGWFDQALGPMLDDFVKIRSEGKGNAQKTRLIIGPWVHGAPGIPNNKRFGQKMLSGMQFYGEEVFQFFDYWLKGVNNGEPQKPALKIFVMGENKWRDENEWPLARTQWTNYYLHSKGKANSKSGDGWLDPIAPGNEPPDKFIYNPENPVPTRGGNFLGHKDWQPGSYDQSKIEEREDVLVYFSPVLTQPVEVTGPVKMVLYAESDAKDTDFTAKLVDVYPDGKAYNLCDGIIRARYRESLVKPTPIEPGKIYKYEIDMWATSNLFQPGHRIGLEISSSNFPQFDRNSNCAGEGGPDCRKIAHQTIYHNSEHPSHLVLPIIPR